MKYFKLKILVLLLFLCLSPLFGQEYGMGAILNPVRYEQTDAKPVLLSRNYTSIPRSFSLKQYSPVPENQGAYSTCTGWASAFAARTISESIALSRTNRVQISNSVFSPVFVYKGHYSLKGINPTGKEGAAIPDVLDFIKSEGAVKRPEFEKTTAFPNISLSAFANSQRYPISSYVRLFSNRFSVPGTVSERVPPVKKSLAEGKPVIIGMNTPPSFHSARNMWRPTESPNREYGGHAMCVVGYDDNMNGGAFEIQNSWGTDWGNNGYIWISYNDFAAFVAEAYEIIENLAIYKDATRFAASIVIEVDNDARGMPVTYDRQGFYRTSSSYPSGTEFRFMMTNRYPAYVYAFSADSNTSGTGRIFPLRGVSPVLDYSDSTIAWPGEHDWIRLDNTVGTDYLVVLYSKEALDIDAIEQRFAGERGAFPERAARAVGQNFIPYNEVQYNGRTMEFSIVSTNPRAVFGLLLAIDHRAR
jgi:hypothetical protein